MATWNIDPLHSSAQFKIKHMGITWAQGQIFDLSGTVDFDPENIEGAVVNATLPVSKITTGNEMRDGHVKSPDFFDVENFPEVTFRSTDIHSHDEEDLLHITGILTIKGIEKEVTLDAEFLGVQQKPNEDGSMAEVAGFFGATEIDRTDFGLNWNIDLPGGVKMLGDNVIVEIGLEAIKA